MSEYAFTMDDGWLEFHPDPSVPEFRLPAGAVDAHCHVFGPGAVFPYGPERKYTPCDAPKERLWALRDHLGVSRNVIVQATCHGTDNRALIDAIAASDDRARGVASVASDVSDEELDRLHAAGIRGVRFSFVKRLVDKDPRMALADIGERIQRLGWHLVVYFESVDLPELHDFLAALPGIVVFDHMGRPDVSQPADGPAFDKFVELMESNDDFWCKVSCPDRLSIDGPPDYDDVVPFARRIVEAFPDRVLWGTDWPHPNLRSHMPDDGKLVDYVARIATSSELQRKLLVANPMQLYWPEAAATSG